MTEWADVSLTGVLGGMLADQPADGFFDAGMLLHALKGVGAERDWSADQPAKRRVVGKKLHLNEY